MKNHNIEKMSSLNVLLTGATGGIGQAVASKLFEYGANLVLVGRNHQKLMQLKSSLVASIVGDEYDNINRVEVLSVDITKHDERLVLCSALEQLTFKVNTIINNAGVNQFKWLEHSEPHELENIMITNALAPMQLTQLLLPLLKTQDNAQVVNVGSTFGSIGYPGYSAYCASKFALRGFSQSLARELADTNISVKYLSPRATKTTLNGASVEKMNEALKTASDSPELVANELIELLASKKQERYIGWPERLFVKVNQVFPNVVSKSIIKQLPVIKRFALSD